jgi:hypothetical protein
LKSVLIKKPENKENTFSKRANYTLNYSVIKGYSEERLTAKEYGESQLVNNCIDGL